MIRFCRPLLCALLGLSMPGFPGARSADPVPPAPQVLYLDLVAGPTTGGENDTGAYVSVFGRHFGTLPGQAHVYFDDHEAVAYRYFGPSRGLRDIQQITVQVGAIPPGDKRVTVVVQGRRSSEDIHFLPAPGNILFVDNTKGNDRSARKNRIDRPWRYLQTPDDGGALSAARPGDVIVLRGKAVWSDVGYGNRWARFISETGNAPNGKTGHGYLTIEAYPGEDVHYIAPPGTSGGIHGVGDGYEDFADWVVISGLHIESNAMSRSDAAPVNLQAASDHWRIVNNELGPWPSRIDAKAAGISGNGLGVKILGNHIHDIEGGTLNHCIYLDTGATDVEIAYNHLHACHGGNIIQTFDNLGMRRLSRISIHHNLMHDGSRYGLNIADGTTSVHAWNNVIFDTAYAGIRINVDARMPVNMLFEHNTLWELCKVKQPVNAAIINTWNAQSGAILFRNNIVAAGPLSSCTAGFQDDAQGVVISFADNLWSSLSPPRADDRALTGDPLFTDPSAGDFILLPHSPAAGKAIVTDITDDFMSNQRTHRDIGALDR